MLMENQALREANRQRIVGVNALRWRAHADEVREKARRMGGEMSAKAMLKIAEDFDFLAEFEERPRRPCL
jgi:hypothetical protein